METRNKDSPVVYICSPYSGNVERNTEMARRYSRYAIDNGYVPITPHLWLPGILSEETEREVAISLDLRLLDLVSELWVCGDTVSEGMKREIDHAAEAGIPVRIFEEENFMYAIDTSNHKINGEKVDTFLRTVLDGDTHLEVEAGTTGFTGACCRDAGSRTYLALLCRKGDFFFGPIKDDEGRVVGIRIACCGDDGLNAIMKSLVFAYHAIDDLCCDVDD